MSNSNAWGTNSYYSADQSQFESQDQETVVATWQNALYAINLDAKRQVEQAKDKWNNRVRELLRSETALKFVRNEFAENKFQGLDSKNGQSGQSSSDDSLRRAPIKIVGGFPPPLVRYFEDITKDAEIVLHSEDFAHAISTLDFSGKNYDRLLHFAETYNGPVTPQLLADVSTLFSNLIAQSNKLKLIDCILKNDVDCLGAYFFRRPEIHIYWLPIAILAQCSPVADIESLTFITLAHELAHAYTHQGKDIDGKDWDTELFAHCDKSIVEGIAQYYTWQLCNRIKASAPQIEQTFDWMLQMQSPAYTRFTAWIETEKGSNKKKQHGEVIRDVILQTRRKQILDLNEYEYEVRESKKRLETGR